MCGSRGGTGGPDPPENHKNIGFSSNTGPDPLKNRSYQVSIQCWADDGPLIRGSWTLPPLINQKYVVKFEPFLTKPSGSAHEIHGFTLTYSICEFFARSLSWDTCISLSLRKETKTFVLVKSCLICPSLC